MTKVLVLGCNGKMGRKICEMIETDPDMEVTVGIDKVRETSNSYPVFNSPIKCPTINLSNNVDVIIDVSSAEGTFYITTYAEHYQIPLVVATTDLSEETLKMLKEAAEEIPVFYSESFYLAAGSREFFAKRAIRAAKFLSNDGRKPALYSMNDLF